jgi:tRNA A-37 threonylcarbamoyl transferase component Bud32
VPTREDIADPLVGTVLGERYRVLDHLAAGAMGRVYRAAHTRIASLFAVKVLYGDLAYDNAMRARFEREAEVASLLQSRYIVRVVDFSHSDSGLPYLAMEYLDGDTLSGVVRRAGPCEPRRALDLAVQIARGLAHAHERGVVHRDLKSDNVMLIREDDADVAKILDFGVARLRASNKLTADRSIVGTPTYMAPEQYAAGEIDGRTDLYALGVTLYELLTGRLPFDSDDAVDLMRKHLTEPPPRLAVALGASAYVEALDVLVRTLLAKRKEDRYVSARAFVDAARPLFEPAAQPQRPAAPTIRAVAPPLPPGPALTVERQLVEKIAEAIAIGATAYNAGDHAKCYAIYRGVVEAALSPARKPPLPLAERARLEVAQAQAASAQGATIAAWTLRHGFDELSSAEPRGPSAPRDVVDASIDVFHAVAGRTYTLGHADAVVPFHLAFGRLLREAVASLPSRAAELPWLDRALDTARTSRGDVGPAVLSEVFDRLRRPVTASAAPGFATSPTAISPPVAIVSESIRMALVRAIRAGVPAYNAGDHAACAREYLRTADALILEHRSAPTTAAVASWLAPVAERARQASPHDAAWMLRHAFDALLSLP